MSCVVQIVFDLGKAWKLLSPSDIPKFTETYFVKSPVTTKVNKVEGALIISVCTNNCTSSESCQNQLESIHHVHFNTRRLTEL